MSENFFVCNLTADILSTSYTGALKDRFLKYVQVWSESDSKKADEGIMPSAERERDMAALLKAELEQLGLEAVQADENCYVYGRLPASPGCGDVPAICLMAHMDTVDEVSGKDVKPLVHENYRGGPICLPAGITLDPEVDAHLAQAGEQGDTIISSDG
ncbi:MAG: peptidase T, partial [Treponema sp.]|nr:peptidase T [Treponema sp.]